jgi:hypothetical protein
MPVFVRALMDVLNRLPPSALMMDPLLAEHGGIRAGKEIRAYFFYFSRTA